MADLTWTPLPKLWPQPAVSAPFAEFDLLVFTEAGVPTWPGFGEVRYDVLRSPSFGLVANGTADSFEAAKAAALFEAAVPRAGMARDGRRWPSLFRRCNG